MLFPSSSSFLRGFDVCPHVVGFDLEFDGESFAAVMLMQVTNGDGLSAPGYAQISFLLLMNRALRNTLFANGSFESPSIKS